MCARFSRSKETKQRQNCARDSHETNKPAREETVHEILALQTNKQSREETVRKILA